MRRSAFDHLSPAEIAILLLPERPSTITTEYRGGSPIEYREPDAAYGDAQWAELAR